MTKEASDEQPPEVLGAVVVRPAGPPAGVALMRRATAQRRLKAALARREAEGVGTGGGDAGTGGDRRPADETATAGDAVMASVLSAAESAGGRVGDLAASLRAALNRVSEGVVICDAAGQDIYRNPRAAELLPSLLDGVLINRAIEDRLAEARHGKASEGPLELFTPTRRILVVRAFPLPRRDDPDLRTGAVAIIEDASERRQIDAIRRDFVANVSHELKTPVGAISLLAETLQDEDDPEIIARLSGRVSAEAGRLALIIDDLLDLSRIEANESPAMAPASVADLMREAVGNLRPLASVRGIALELAPIAGGLTLLCDRRDVLSAISNLVDNAIKYSEDGGAVSVRCCRAGAMVDIAVSDRGIGIPQRELARVFERFYRVDRARSRSTGGTGLGLSIVRHVAANHGGTVQVDSREGEGSTFTLRLPLRGTKAEEEHG